MKRSKFKETAIDILGEKLYNAFNERYTAIADECALKLFMKSEISTKRAEVIRSFIKRMNSEGWMRWDDEED